MKKRILAAAAAAVCAAGMLAGCSGQNTGESAAPSNVENTSGNTQSGRITVTLARHEYRSDP